MSVTRISVLLSFVVLTTQAVASPGRCAVAANSPLLRAVRDPENTSEQVWRSASRELNRLMAECPDGPTDEASRRRFFNDYVAREFALDYRALGALWEKRGEGLTTGGWESIEYERIELLNYLDRIVDPKRDQPYANIILDYGNGQAMARLGRSVKDQVLLRARPGGGNQKPERRAEAIRALGHWTSARYSEFSRAEKQTFVSTIVEALPDPKAPMLSEQIILSRACIEALGRSSDLDAAKVLTSWASSQEQEKRFATELVVLARKAADAIRRRAAAVPRS